MENKFPDNVTLCNEIIIILSNIAECTPAETFSSLLPLWLWDNIALHGRTKLLSSPSMRNGTAVFDGEDVLHDALIPTDGLYRIFKNFKASQWEGKEYQGLIKYWNQSVKKGLKTKVIKANQRKRKPGTTPRSQLEEIS